MCLCTVCQRGEKSPKEEEVRWRFVGFLVVVGYSLRVAVSFCKAGIFIDWRWCSGWRSLNDYQNTISGNPLLVRTVNLSTESRSVLLEDVQFLHLHFALALAHDFHTCTSDYVT